VTCLLILLAIGAIGLAAIVGSGASESDILGSDWDSE
jgi:hypothetical protein